MQKFNMFNKFTITIRRKYYEELRLEKQVFFKYLGFAKKEFVMSIIFEKLVDYAFLNKRDTLRVSIEKIHIKI